MVHKTISINNHHKLISQSDLIDLLYPAEKISITPKYSNHSNILVTFCGMSKNLYQFEDLDGEIYECDVDEINNIMQEEEFNEKY